MAESYAKHKFPNQNISSRGLFVNEMTTNSRSLDIIKEKNLTAPSAPKQLTEEDIKDSKLLVMSQSHKQAIQASWPQADVQLISEFATGESADINDPYGGTPSDYEAVFEQLKYYIDKFEWRNR